MDGVAAKAAYRGVPGYRGAACGVYPGARGWGWGWGWWWWILIFLIFLIAIAWSWGAWGAYPQAGWGVARNN